MCSYLTGIDGDGALSSRSARDVSRSDPVHAREHRVRAGMLGVVAMGFASSAVAAWSSVPAKTRAAKRDVCLAVSDRGQRPLAQLMPLASSSVKPRNTP